MPDADRAFPVVAAATPAATVGEAFMAGVCAMALVRDPLAARVALALVAALGSAKTAASTESRAAASEPNGVSAGDRPPGARLCALTAREHDVARRIACGCTNREIAAALYLSVRTVETHVSHILAKLGVSRRSAVAALVGPISARECDDPA